MIFDLESHSCIKDDEILLEVSDSKACKGEILPKESEVLIE
jgi:hypothetical protein